VLAVCLLPGCSLFDSVNNSLNYADQATTYINDVNGFANEIPALAEQAVTDVQARTTLKQEFEKIKEKVAAFDGIQAPAFAKEIHQQLVSYNETLMKEINGYLEKINNGAIDWRSIANSQMVETITKITGILDQVKNISQ
jgi:isopentenyl diphosphate isomerase/L-lactate dehydrogenase-like FMN-dependent dehydrogenase